MFQPRWPLVASVQLLVQPDEEQVDGNIQRNGAEVLEVLGPPVLQGRPEGLLLPFEVFRLGLEDG